MSRPVDELARDTWGQLERFTSVERIQFLQALLERFAWHVEAREIIRLHAAGWSQRKIASLFNRTKGTVQAIVEGVNHQHLERPDVEVKVVRGEHGRFQRVR